MSKKWQAWEIDLLMSDVPCNMVAEKTGRSLTSIYKKKERLGKTSPTQSKPLEVPDVRVCLNARNELIIVIKKEVKEKVVIKFKGV